MNSRRGGDHGIFDQSVRFAVFEARPFPKDGSVYRQDGMAGDDPVEPRFDLFRFRPVPLSRQFYAGLNFSDRDGGQNSRSAGAASI